MELHQNGNRVTVERVPTANHYKLQVEAFSRTVRTGEAYPCPLEFVRGTQAMMDRVMTAPGTRIMTELIGFAGKIVIPRTVSGEMDGSRGGGTRGTISSSGSGMMAP